MDACFAGSGRRSRVDWAAVVWGDGTMSDSPPHVSGVVVTAAHSDRQIIDYGFLAFAAVCCDVDGDVYRSL
jgi:hypothetical protein